MEDVDSMLKAAKADIETICNRCMNQAALLNPVLDPKMIKLLKVRQSFYIDLLRTKLDFED